MDTPEGWVLLHRLDAKKQKVVLYLKRSAVVSVGCNDANETILGLQDGFGYLVSETPNEALAAIMAQR